MGTLSRNYEAAGQHLRGDEKNAYDAFPRRGIEEDILHKSDIVIDMGGVTDNASTRHVAVMSHDDNEAISFFEMDSDLVQNALCHDNVHSLSELAFGQNNQFAPHMDTFRDAYQLSDLPPAIKGNIQEAFIDDNSQQSATIDRAIQQVHCTTPGMGT